MQIAGAIFFFSPLIHLLDEIDYENRINQWAENFLRDQYAPLEFRSLKKKKEKKIYMCI